MKISNTTREILRNFSKINSSIVLKPGNVITTVADSRFLVARAEIEESIPVEVPISKSLGSLLDLIELFDDPDVEFGPRSLIVTAGRNKLSFRYADASSILSPKKDPADAQFDWNFEFKIEAAEMKRLLKASSLLSNAPNVVFSCDGTSPIKVTVTDVSDPSANEFSVEVGATHATPFKIVLKRENIIMIESDYIVKVHFGDERKVTRWDRAADNKKSLAYWASMEISSKYGE